MDSLELTKSQSKLTLWTEGNFLRIESVDTRTALFMEIMENYNIDSNCLFESIMQFLTDRNIPHKLSINQFRRDLVNYVVTHWNDMYFGLPHLIGMELEETAVAALRAINISISKDIYRKHMLKPTVFGTEIELLAASKIYDFDFCVFRVVGYNYTCRNTIGIPVSEQKLFLLCTGPENNAHFNFLRPIHPRNPDFITEGNYIKVSSRGPIIIRK